MEVPRQCPLVLLVKVRSRKSYVNNTYVNNLTATSKKTLLITVIYLSFSNV
jgi:hypothetical protein